MIRITDPSARERESNSKLLLMALAAGLFQNEHIINKHKGVRFEKPIPAKKKLNLKAGMTNLQRNFQNLQPLPLKHAPLVMYSP